MNDTNVISGHSGIIRPRVAEAMAAARILSAKIKIKGEVLVEKRKRAADFLQIHTTAVHVHEIRKER